MRRPRGIAWLVGLACLGFAVHPAGAATDKIVVDEFLLRCADVRPDGAFVELVATGPGQTFDAALGIRLTGPSGGTVADLPGAFARRAGQSWPQGQHFLIATSSFEALTGVAPDTVFAAAPAANGGSIILYRKSGTTLTVLNRVDYASTSGLAPTPPPGRSAFSTLPGLFHWSPDPSPTRSDGVLARAPGCFADPHRPIRITELATQCGSGNPTGGFVEIAALDDNETLDGDLALRALDHAGAPLFDVPLGFGTLEGSPWLVNRPWLVGDGQMKSAAGDGPDLVWPQPLDTAGGRVVLHGRDATGAEIVLAEIEYGTTALPAPPPGSSLVWDPFTGGYVQKSPSSPTDFQGRAHLATACVPPSSVRIQELLTACTTSGLHASYVELMATADGEMRDSSLAIEIRNASDSLTALVPCGFGSLAGSPWPSNTTWLLATSGIASYTNAPADMALPVALDPIAGRIDVLRRVGSPPGTTEIIQSLRWGGTRVAPAPGQAIRRFTDTEYRLVTAAPINSNSVPFHCLSTDPGAPPPPPPGPPTPPPTGSANTVRLAAVMLGCADGSTGAQFIQIDRTSTQTITAQDLQLRVLGRNGTMIVYRDHLFPYDNASWGGHTSLVIGGPDFRSTYGFDPDATLPLAMDPTGGTIQLVRTDVLSELRYGVIAPATALVMDQGTWRPDSLPHPRGFGGDGLMSPFCGGPCALQRVQLSLAAPQSMAPSVGACSDLYNDIRYDLPRAEFELSSRNLRAELLLSDEYAIAGLANPETLETFVDVLETHADTCIRNLCTHSTRRVQLIVNGEVVDSLPPDANKQGRLHARAPFLPGQSTHVQVFAEAGGVLVPALLGRVFGRLGFERPRGGARVVSCAGYDFERALVVHDPEWSVSPHTIAIDWRVSADSGFTANVERLDESESTPVWRLRAVLPAEPPGVLRYTDNKVSAENTYRYRLAWSDAFGSYTSDEIRIHAPRLPSFALFGALPNPAHGTLRVAFELPDPAGVHVELFDLLGRRVREVRTALTSGPQSVLLDQGSRLAPGLYQVRLEAGGYRAHTTIVVLP